MSVTHPPGEHVEVRGHRLWVEREGAGPPVLLLSGFGPAGAHTVFHPWFTPLADDYEVIYVDLYGRGRSDRPASLEDITFDGDVADLAALIRTLGTGAVHLYGFSYGGLLAQELALSHQELVRTLTVANSLHSPHMWQRNHQNINRELANQFPVEWAEIERLRAAGVVSTDAQMKPLFARAGPNVRFFNPDNAARIATEDGDRNLELYPYFVGDDVDFEVGGQVSSILDFRSRLGELGVPMMVLGGRFDRALYPALQYEFVAAAPPGASIHILERSGSYSHVEEPERVLELMRDHLARAR